MATVRLSLDKADHTNVLDYDREAAACWSPRSARTTPPSVRPTTRRPSWNPSGPGSVTARRTGWTESPRSATPWA